MRVAVIGSGYVGLVCAAGLARHGHEVICVDSDANRLARIEAGEVPFHEPDLSELLGQVLGKTLSVSSDLQRAVRLAQVTLIAVGTPSSEGRIDLTQVRAAAMQIGRALRDGDGYRVVVVKSTVIPGTTEGLVRSVLERESGARAGIDFGLGMNPEFLTEGQAVDDFLNPDRIVLGGIDMRTIDTLAALYDGFGPAPLIRTGNTTAEMIKYASNALLATLISWSNEMAQLCEALPGVDVAQVMPAVHASAYLSPRMPDGTVVRAPIAGFIEAGCGFGGSCLPKDVAALVAQGQSLGQPMRLLSATLRINEEQPARLLALLREHYPDLEGVSVAVLGLAFRPGTDDTRQSPAWPIIEALRRAGAQVSVHDPVAKLPEPYKPGVRQIASLRQALIQADAVMLITRWPEYAALDQILASLGHAPLVIDGRRILKPEKFARYEGIGRPSLRATQAHATA